MAAHHTTGFTPTGAADPIIAWFAIFEAWITGTVGWIVAAGAGTTNMYITSTGEPGSGYVMLFVHVWRVGNTVRIEVADGSPPTHETTEAGFVDSGGAADFRYWMTANLECVIIVWQLGGSCRFVYAGAIMPYGTTPIDETYHMVATSSHGTCSILRDSAGLWDQDKNNYWNAQSDNLIGSVDCDNHPLFGLYCDRQNVIAGQYWFLSGEINPNANIAFGDTLNTAITGSTSSWIVLDDHLGNRFALWTGGVWPAGVQYVPGHFNSWSGLANNGPHLVSSIAGAAALHGWTSHGDPGFPRADPGDSNNRLSSPGETEGPLNVTVSWDNSTSRLELFIHDDPAYSNYTYAGVVVGAFPTGYYESGDWDCICAAVLHNALFQLPTIWAGKLAMAPPDLSDPVNMKMAAAVLDQATQDAYLLRGRDGTWTPGGDLRWSATNTRLNTNANAYDPTTYYVHLNFVTLGVYEFSGITKYFGYTNGGGIAQHDNILVAGRWNRVNQFNNTPHFCTMAI